MKTYKSKINKLKLVREPSEIAKVKFGSSLDVSEYARSLYDSDDITIYESFYVIMLNNSNNTTGYALISKGGITGTVVDVRLVAKYCLDALATSCVLVHNHPSGNLTPSDADKNITKKIKNGLELLDIRVLDHIILTENSYYSFSDNNLI